MLLLAATGNSNKLGIPLKYLFCVPENLSCLARKICKCAYPATVSISSLNHKSDRRVD